MVNKVLVEHKQKAKSKQPKFVRQEYNKRKQLPLNWRKPRGVHSKLRLRRRGKPQMVSVGYKMPDEVRGLTREGLQQVFVSAPEHLKFIKTGEVAVLHKVSNKRRLEILQAAQKLNAKILNFKDISKRIDEIKARLTAKQAARKKKGEKRAKKEAEAKKKAKMSVKQKQKEEKPEKSIEKLIEKEEAKPEVKKKEEKKVETKVEPKKEVKPKTEKKVEKKETKPKIEKKEAKRNTDKS